MANVVCRTPDLGVSKRMMHGKCSVSVSAAASGIINVLEFDLIFALEHPQMDANLSDTESQLGVCACECEFSLLRYSVPSDAGEYQPIEAEMRRNLEGERRKEEIAPLTLGSNGRLSVCS